jgi:hypothetical protein
MTPLGLLGQQGGVFLFDATRLNNWCMDKSAATTQAPCRTV